MPKGSSLYHSKTGQMGLIFKMSSEIWTIRNPDKFIWILNTIRISDHWATGQELNSIKSDGPDFGC